MADRIKTLFVTDVPFWNRQTGAQNRIAQLIDALNVPPFHSSALLTQVDPKLDWDNVNNLSSVPVAKIDLSLPPAKGIGKRIKWEISAIANWLGWKQSNKPTSFDNYYRPTLVSRFCEMIAADPPDIIVFEYATQTQLLRALPDSLRGRLVTVLDSHDVLWKRSLQFEQQGEDHWISVSQAQEESALKEYDLILAIQSREAKYFENVVGEDRVTVTSMEFDNQSSPLSGQKPKDPAEVNSQPLPGPRGISIGYMASNNWANVDAANQILTNWPGVVKKFPAVNLVIAGSVCEDASVSRSASQLEGIRMLGKVDSVNDFYRIVDLIWNPVRFGTGLKIKNIEALGHAKCLVTSSHGAEGLFADLSGESAADKTGIFVSDRPEELTNTLKGLDVHVIRNLGSIGQKHVEKYFGKGTQYPPLRQRLHSLLSAKLP